MLEVLQILEGEVNLREETRVAEQARPALAVRGVRQAGRQALRRPRTDCSDRVDKVIDRIRDCPTPRTSSPTRSACSGKVAGVMDEATEILARPETGSPAIAAETEAIELLLQSKRINPKRRRRRRGEPGRRRQRQDRRFGHGAPGRRRQPEGSPRGPRRLAGTGESGPVLPEEFRAGLDEYFNRLERGARRPVSRIRGTSGMSRIRDVLVVDRRRRGGRRARASSSARLEAAVTQRERSRGRGQKADDQVPTPKAKAGRRRRQRPRKPSSR